MCRIRLSEEISKYQQLKKKSKVKSKSNSCYDRRSVSQSVCRGVKFTLEPVTRCYILSERCCVVPVGRPLWREVGSVFFSHFRQCLVHCQRCNIIYIVHVTCFKYSETCIRRNRMGPKIFSTLDKFPHYTKYAKFEPLMFSVSGFALPNMADICIFMIFYNSCLLSA
jgi:hypothetical protein